MREDEFGSFHELASNFKELRLWAQVSTYVVGKSGQVHNKGPAKGSRREDLPGH